jgi:hypothetical protein
MMEAPMAGSAQLPDPMRIILFSLDFAVSDLSRKMNLFAKWT